MAGSYNYGDNYTVDEQVVFASYMTKALTDAGIPFAVNADSHFYDREKGEWIDQMQPVFIAIYGKSHSPLPVWNRLNSSTPQWHTPLGIINFENHAS